MSNTNAFGSSAFRQKETVSLVSLTHWPQILDAPGLCSSKKRLRKRPPPTSCDACTNVFIYLPISSCGINATRWPISDLFAGLIKIRVQKFAIFVPLAPPLLPKVTDLCRIDSVQTIWTYLCNIAFSWATDRVTDLATVGSLRGCLCGLWHVSKSRIGAWRPR